MQSKSKFPNRVACNKVPFSLERESLEMLPGNRVAGLWGKRGVTWRQEHVHGVALPRKGKSNGIGGHSSAPRFLCPCQKG